MKRYPLGYLLAAGIAAICISAYAASPTDTADPPPDHWMVMYKTPIFDGFFMSAGGLAGKQFGFTIWNKVIFKKPQTSPAGTYQQRILKLAINCEGYKYAVLRDIEYAADGQVLHESAADAPRFIPYTQKKASDDHVINTYVLGDDDIGCHRTD